MVKEMIVSSNDRETAVAILEDDQVVEFFIEREKQQGVVGNVYKGRVSKVLPGMQSAFVDLGLERDAFLYVSDVINPSEEALEADDEDAGGEVVAVDDTGALPLPALAAEPADAEAAVVGIAVVGIGRGHAAIIPRERAASRALASGAGLCDGAATTDRGLPMNVRR